MNTKLFTGCALLALLSGVFSYSLAQGIVIDDCGDACQGHVFSGSEIIQIVSGRHRITLDGVYIDVEDQDNTAAFTIARDAEVNLTLVNKNVLKSGAGCAGLQVPQDASLVVSEYSTGTLEVIGGMRGAGIGGGADMDCGTVLIQGGFIYTAGKDDFYFEGGAGIGGGYNGDGGRITISGGVVDSTGGLGAAGIGGGYNGAGGEISITGGIVAAGSSGKLLVYDMSSGAGIGGGENGYGGSITIEGGVVISHGGIAGAGIGGGMDGSGGDIRIHGGLIHAHARKRAAGIGSAGDCANDSIEIHGGYIEANGGEWGGAGIGGGYPYATMYSDEILIAGGVTIAEGGYTQTSVPSGAGIGGSGGKTNSPIFITGGYVHAKAGVGGSAGGAGIGSGGFANADTIMITGGRIIADAGVDEEIEYGGAGIGSGGNALADNIVILGGDIQAKGHRTGAGIGNGERKETAIQIDGGSLVANNGCEETNAISGNLEYAQGEVVSNERILEPNTETMDYRIWL